MGLSKAPVQVSNIIISRILANLRKCYGRDFLRAPLNADLHVSCRPLEPQHPKATTQGLLHGWGTKKIFHLWW